MGRTVADLKILRDELVRRRWQAAYAVADDLDIPVLSIAWIDIPYGVTRQGTTKSRLDRGH